MEPNKLTAKSRIVYQKRSELAIKVSRHLYRSVDGRGISLAVRKEKLGLDDASLTYGEIVPQSFLQILRLCNPMARDEGSGALRFVDLGSGTGRACITAALSPHGFTHVTGIELLPELHSAALLVQESLKTMLERGPELILNELQTKKRVQNRSKITTTSISSLESIVVKVLSIRQAGSQFGDSSHALPLDYLANLVCKDMGHKAFKAAVKPYKTFMRFIVSKPELFQLSSVGNSKTVCLVEPSAASLYSEVVCENYSTRHGSSDDINAPDLDDRGVPTTGVGASPLVLSGADVAMLDPMPTISFLCGSIFDIDWWSDSDVAYAASLLFSEEMIGMLTQRALQMRDGSWIISLKPLALTNSHIRTNSSSGYAFGVGLGLDKHTCSGSTAESPASMLQLRHESFFKMSWQMAKVYIYQVCHAQS